MKLKLVAVTVAALVPVVALLAYNEVAMRFLDPPRSRNLG
jgi:hypothetical protein